MYMSYYMNKEIMLTQKIRLKLSIDELDMVLSLVTTLPVYIT